MTELAFRIQASYNHLIERVKAHDAESERNPFEIRRTNDESTAAWEEEKTDLEFTVGELYRIAVNVDYADELGRRKMFTLVREMISQRALPDSLVASCLDVLRKLNPNEKDFVRLVVEVIQVMRDPGVNLDEDTTIPGDADTDMGDTPVKGRAARLFQAPEEKSEEELAKAAEIDMRCLSLCIAMLERVMTVSSL